MSNEAKLLTCDDDRGYVTSLSKSAFIKKEIMSFCNTYYLLRPLDTKSFINLTSRILTSDPGSEDGSVQYETVITDVLRQMGIPAHIKGYHYLREAIKLSLEDEEMLECITKLLYPSVAKRFGTAPACVERAIRHAIEAAWKGENREALYKMFGYSVKAGRPTNSEFIATITDDLRIWFGSSSIKKQR